MWLKMKYLLTLGLAKQTNKLKKEQRTDSVKKKEQSEDEKCSRVTPRNNRKSLLRCSLAELIVKMGNTHVVRKYSSLSGKILKKESFEKTKATNVNLQNVVNNKFLMWLVQPATVGPEGDAQNGEFPLNSERQKLCYVLYRTCAEMDGLSIRPAVGRSENGEYNPFWNFRACREQGEGTSCSLKVRDGSTLLNTLTCLVLTICACVLTIFNRCVLFCIHLSLCPPVVLCIFLCYYCVTRSLGC